MSDVQDNIAGARPEAAAQAANVELFDFYVAELEAYLDGELASEEASQVRRRLMQEEAYAAALGRLHACRIQRVEAYKRIEHEETDLEAAARIAASARRLAHSRQPAVAGAGSWPTWTKVVFGMAACLLVGFAAGLIGKYDFGEEPAVGESNPAPARDNFDGWVQFVDGEPRMSVPSDARPLEMDDNGMTPLLMPRERGIPE